MLRDQYERDRKDARLADPFPWGDKVIEHYYSSRAALTLLKEAASRALRDAIPEHADHAALLAIGSLGRMDGIVGSSDADLMLVLPEQLDDRRAIGDAFYTRLVSHNHCLLFDHRDAIEAGAIAGIESRVHSYPVLAASELTAENESGRARRMQALFEGTPLLNEAEWIRIAREVTASYGMKVDLPPLFPNASFQADFHAFADGMWKAIADSEASEPQPNNHKIAKALFLRSFTSRVDGLTVAMTAYMHETIATTEDLLGYLSAPSFVKLGFWVGDRFGRWFSKKLSPETQARICTRVGETRAGREDSVLSEAVRTGRLDSVVQRAVNRCARGQDLLLSYLYSHDLVERIKVMGSNYGTWMNRDNLRELRKEAINADQTVRSFAELVDIVFEEASLQDTAMRYPYENSRLQRWVRWARDWNGTLQ